MRQTLRQMIDSGQLNAATAAKPAKSAAEHVSNHIQDPLGSTKEGFEDLQQKQLEYELAKQTMKQKLAPVKAVIQHVEDTHELADEENPDESMGYQDPNQPQKQAGFQPGQQNLTNPGKGLPPNLQQQPGKMQQRNPAAGPNTPGAGPAVNEQQKIGNSYGQQPGMPAKPTTTSGPKQVKAKPKAQPKGQMQRGIKVHVQAAANGYAAPNHAMTILAAAKPEKIRAKSKCNCEEDMDCDCDKKKMDAGGPGSGRRPGSRSK